MNIHFATAWECVAEAFPHRAVGICDGQTLTWGDFERRAACLAALLEAHGLGAGSAAAFYLRNCNEYLEGHFAVFKLGGCPVNINYRYKADELVYLLDNVDVEVVFFQSCYAMRIWEIKDRLPGVKLFVQIDDGTDMLMDFAMDYERGIRDTQRRPVQDPDPDGKHIVYTRGKTGRPKAVEYQVGAFTGFLLKMGAERRGLRSPATLPYFQEFLDRIDYPPVTVVGCSLMDWPGMWFGAYLPMMMGGTVVTTSRLNLDPHLLWSMVEQSRASDMVIAGDSASQLLLEAMLEASARRSHFDLRGFEAIYSSGELWSAESKLGLLEHHNFDLVDILSSAEGYMGSALTNRETLPVPVNFELAEGVLVVDNHGHSIGPGAGQPGRIAISSPLALGYRNNPEQAADSFVSVNGETLCLPGDQAIPQEDGTATLLVRATDSHPNDK